MNQKGFIQTPLLIAILSSIILASAIIAGGILIGQDKLAPLVADISQVFKNVEKATTTESIKSEEPKLEAEKEKLTAEVEMARQEMEKTKFELKNLKKDIEQTNIFTKPKSVVPITTLTPMPNSELNSISPSIEKWAELESKYFTEANQKEWTSLIITNALGEKRYYRKEGQLWVMKNSEAEIKQPYVVLPTPPTSAQLTRLIRFCSSDPGVQAICDMSEFMPGYYSNSIFRNEIDKMVLEHEDIVFNQQNRNIALKYILPPVQLPSDVFSSPLQSHIPPSTFYIPPKTYSPPSPPSTGRVEFYRDLNGRIYSSSNGANYFYDLNGRLDSVIGPNGTAHINYDLRNGNVDSITY